jgi:hypothetical protein
VQAAGVYSFDLGRFATNQLIVGGEQRMKQQTFINQRLFQVDAQGNFVAGTDALGVSRQDVVPQVEPADGW